MELNETVMAIKDNKTRKMKYVMGLLEFEQYLDQLKNRKFGMDKLAYDLTNTIIALEDQEQTQQPQQPLEQELEQMSTNPPQPMQQRQPVAQPEYEPEEDDPFEQQAAPLPQTQSQPMKSKEKPFMPQLPDQLLPKRAVPRQQIPQPRMPFPQPMPQDTPPRPPVPNRLGRKQKQQELENNEELDYEGDEKNIFDEDGF